jgi:hypothetical protein
MRERYWMLFNTHSNLVGQHAFLGASKYHWVNYDDEKLERVFLSSIAAQRGTELHALAHDLIRLGQKLPRSNKSLNMYVNDAIGFRMTSEQVLYYSDNCFGTADSISFRGNFLRIHDLKTGVIPRQPTQLKVYAAMFCLEYHFKPFDIAMEFRIYQNDEVDVTIGDPEEIAHIMDKIVVFDRRIQELRIEALS